MGHVGPLGKNLNFFDSLGIAEILGFSELSAYTEVALLKTFPHHFELCLYCNIEEVIKFYILGYKTFETDFRLCIWYSYYTFTRQISMLYYSVQGPVIQGFLQ